jgi:hypothetical protein
MYRAVPILLVESLLAHPRSVQGQDMNADSTFLTGPCPTRFADSVKWDNVVTGPDQRARMRPESRLQFPVYLRRGRGTTDSRVCGDRVLSYPSRLAFRFVPRSGAMSIC